MRIVSLLASATEMVAELGYLSALVGRSHECDYPPEVLHLPAVSRPFINVDTSSEQIDAQIKQLARARDETQGNALKALSIYTIDTDLLQRLKPDLLLTQTQCEVCAVSENDVIAALQHVIGIQPHIVALAPYRLQDVWNDMLRIGTALHATEVARQRIAIYTHRLEQLQAQTASAQKPRVAVLEWLDPLMGAGNWIPELVAYAGGEAVCGGTGTHAPWLSWQELQAVDPDVLILSPCGFSLERTVQEYPQLQQHPQWKTLRAVKTNRVYAIDGNQYMNRSSPRLVQSAELIAYALWGHPAPVDPTACLQLAP
uniref:Cobalamin-binding protein n=1 Tax=Thermosporothrix sp. COM3 TaxID=2490863 RepID=A0A455SZ03_9CHLR|nr:cobalamin-binding protein [Thermosporothrix sp. COM3]